jgi:hypothetical protein
MRPISQENNISDVLRSFVRSGHFPEISTPSAPIHEAMRQAIRESRRLGFDTRTLAASAVDALLPLERYLRLFKQARQAAVIRLLGIIIMCLFMRGLFGAGARFADADIAFAVVWMALQSIIFATAFDDGGGGVESGRLSVVELIRGYLTMGHLTQRESPLWVVMRRIRRDEIASGFDGHEERARVFLEEFRRRVDHLALLIEKSRWRFILAEIMTAVVTFACMDGLPILRWLESGSNFADL